MRTGDFRYLIYLLSLLAIVSSVLFILAQAPRVQAWAWDTHRFIVDGAENVFSDGSFFSDHLTTLLDWCVKPDQWKSSNPYERYRHWYHIDEPEGENEYYRGGLPDNWAMLDKGVLPWAVEDNFATLVQRLEDENWENAAQLMGAISHYTADATMPLHATSDYNPGWNHGPYEHEVNYHLDEMLIPEYVPQELDNVFDATMTILYGSFDLTDEDSAGGVNLSDFLENDILWNDTIRSITENRLQAGVQFTANLWYTAMIQAGRTIQAPTLVFPSDGATPTDNTPTFSWNSVSSASSYDFQLSSDNSFTTDVLTIKDLSTTSYTPDNQLACDNWYWRVRSGDNSTHVGLWSQIRWATVLTSPDSIYIDGNDNFTSANGVVGGSGTGNDPYIIENWAISAENAHGIEIRDTTAYFIIRNCLVEKGGSNYHGIYLDNVVNGRIENCISRNNNFGIRLEYSFNNTLDKNICKNNYPFWGAGIQLDGSDNNTLVNNVCENNRGEGIQLENSDNNILSNNTFENNHRRGIVLRYSDNNLILNNVVENNDWSGILLFPSSNNTVTGNTSQGNGYAGIHLRDSDNNTLDNNTYLSNNIGIHLWDSDNNLIYHNNFVNNENQAYDNGSNYWDNGYPSGGNYWSGYTGVDENRGENQEIPGSDGIGDTPYNILGGTNQDRYPLVGPWSTFKLDLVKGWNLISIPARLENQTRGAIFEGVTHFMSGWTGTSYYTPGMSDNLEPGEGYWVWISTAATIELSGVPLENFTLDLDSGWNLVGIPKFDPPLDNRARGAIFEGVTHFMSGWTGTSYYTPGMSDNLEPDEGYWVWVSIPAEITLP